MDVETFRSLSEEQKMNFLYSLRGGLEHFRILSDDSLAANQMAERVGVSRSRVRSYRSALIKAGLLDRRLSLKSDQITELCEKYGISRTAASTLKSAMGNLKVLSRDDLTTGQMGEELNVTVDMVRHYRSILGKVGLIQPRPPKTRSNEITELCEKYNVSRQFAYSLKHAIRHLPILSNGGLSYVQMAEEMGCSVPMVNIYRSALIKAGLVERKNKVATEDDKKKALELRQRGYTISDIRREIGSSSIDAYTDERFPALRTVMAIKRFFRATTAGAKIFSLNSREAEAANLTTGLEYYAAVEPYFLQFYLRVFDAREKAAGYILSKHFDISKFDELTEHLLGTSRRRFPADVVRKILKLRVVGYTMPEISNETSVSISTVKHYTDQIPGSKELKHLKKLSIMNEFGGRLFSVNRNEQEQAGMDPAKEYFGVAEPDNMEFLLNVFDSREGAASYAVRNPRLVELYSKT